jgi:hypothetical protein
MVSRIIRIIIEAAALYFALGLVILYHLTTT